jgi:hypothetical protein
LGLTGVDLSGGDEHETDFGSRSWKVLSQWEKTIEEEASKK